MAKETNLQQVHCEPDRLLDIFTIHPSLRIVIFHLFTCINELNGADQGRFFYVDKIIDGKAIAAVIREEIAADVVTLNPWLGCCPGR